MSFLAGRSNRAEYWASIALLLAISFAATYLFDQSLSNFWTIIFFQCVYARRLHDIDRTAWWGVVALAAASTPLMLGVLFGGPGFVAALAGQSDQVTDLGRTWYYVVAVSSVVLENAFTIWLGLQKGDPCQNRFGYMPKQFRWPGRSASEIASKDAP
jgi:uncharacterized membrane protein YhaH (DUF805 family)